MADEHTTAPGAGPPSACPRRWRAPGRPRITHIEQNRILIRGYHVDEMMAPRQLRRSHLPAADGRPAHAGHRQDDRGDPRLVRRSRRDAAVHGRRAQRRHDRRAPPAGVAAGVLAFGAYHGGDVEACMRMLDGGLDDIRRGSSLQDAAQRLIDGCLAEGQRPPGFGHRLHTRDPRAVRLMQLAMDLELDAEHIRLMRMIERLLESRTGPQGEAMPMNVDGAIAAVCGDLGLDYEFGNALFIISRVPGLIAHAHEERLRQSPMRQIDPTDHVYDGPSERRLPETRK